ncbi:MAG TPA: MFS transporter [Microvirga sp.]|nr:MFS transporter [Microvirga sp.]
MLAAVLLADLYGAFFALIVPSRLRSPMSTVTLAAARWPALLDSTARAFRGELLPMRFAGRHRVLVSFAAFGLFWGAWGASLPALQRRSGADDGEIGIALVLVGFGALVSMRATGVLLDRVGPRLTPMTIAAFAIAGALPGLATSPAVLFAFALVLGTTSGAMDVAINTDGVREEVASGRPLLNLAHACFSVAVVGASIATGLLRAAGGGPILVFALTATLVTAAALLVRPLREERRPPTTRGERPRLLERVPGWLLMLGFAGALAYWIENAWQSWSAVHLERTLEASPALGALGPALFAASMAAGRLLVHRLARPGTERVVLVGGATTAAAGSALAAFAPTAPVLLVGLVVAGAGCSVCAPTLVSVAGRAAPESERATLVGSLTTLMYFGFLAGPAAVGGLADATTLRTSLAGVAALGLLLAALAGVIRLPPRR